MEGIFSDAGDYVGYEEDSLSGNDCSSEDDIDIVLQGTPERKLKLSRRRQSVGSKSGHEEGGSSSEDDFEKEMDRELDEHVAVLESLRKPQNSERKTSGNENKGDNSRFPGEVYVDSDEEEMIEGGSKGKLLVSNDDLLYDPDMDDEDEKWVADRRQRYLSVQRPNVQKQSPRGKHERSKQMLPSSDAVLDCPACLTTLCLDCQRHDLYQNQYRAMFVSHCTVDFNEKMKYPKEKEVKKQGKKTRFTDSNQGVSDNVDDCDEYNPVRCSQCNTLVAMYDNDEVYHFFNVVSSYG